MSWGLWKAVCDIDFKAKVPEMQFRRMTQNYPEVA
jgi:hypothetical protein